MLELYLLLLVRHLRGNKDRNKRYVIPRELLYLYLSIHHLKLHFNFVPVLTNFHLSLPSITSNNALHIVSIQSVF